MAQDKKIEDCLHLAKVSTIGNREIKFRVWDKVDYMSTPFTLNDLILKKVQFTTDCRVVQYTGLKDKNGKEVYEGDVVKAAWMHHGKPGEEFTAFVFYNEHISSFRIGYDSLGGGSQDEIYFRYQIEVIGNAYENPALIEWYKKSIKTTLK